MSAISYITIKYATRWLGDLPCSIAGKDFNVNKSLFMTGPFRNMDVVIFLVYVATKRVELPRHSFAASARKRVNSFFKFKCLRLRSDAASLRKRTHLNLKKQLTRFLAKAATEHRRNSTRFVATYTRKITTSIFTSIHFKILPVTCGQGGPDLMNLTAQVL